MKCSICNKPVKEKGDCEQCLPFRIATSTKLSASNYRSCQKAVLANLEVLKAMAFSQNGANREAGKKPDQIVVDIDGRNVAMEPYLNLDLSERPFVLISWPGSKTA